MPSPKDIKNRIASVTSTHKITRTMEMVATSKFKKASTRVRAAQPFAEVLPAMLGLVAAAGDGDGTQPLLERRAEVKRVALLVLSTNRGLCGPLNTNLLKKVMVFRMEVEDQGRELDLHVVGRKGLTYFRFMDIRTASEKNDLSDMPGPEDADFFVEKLVKDFMEGCVDEVHVAYSHFKNPAEQPPRIEQLLPLVPPEEEGEDEAEDKIRLDFIFEPDLETLLGELLPLYLRNSALRILLEMSASEHSARRTAMKAATDSAEDMIKALTIYYNKARQTAITTELLEIVAGAEALK